MYIYIYILLASKLSYIVSLGGVVKIVLFLALDSLVSPLPPLSPPTDTQMLLFHPQLRVPTGNPIPRLPGKGAPTIPIPRGKRSQFQPSKAALMSLASCLVRWSFFKAR